MSMENGSDSQYRLSDLFGTSFIFRDRQLSPDRSISNPEIYEIMPALHFGVAELKAAIVNGNYGALISDDISGHIPTLIIRGVIDHVNNANGRHPIPTFFVEGRETVLDSSDEQRLTTAMQRLAKERRGTRALIVTEFMAGGNHIKSISDVIHDAEISLDVFAASRTLDTQIYRRRNVIRDDEEVFPIVGYMTHLLGIYHRTQLSSSIEDKECVYVDADFRGSLVDVREDMQAAVAQLVNKYFLLAA